MVVGVVKFSYLIIDRGRSSMSDDLKGAIITAVVTGLISVIGFIITNLSMRRNFKNELLKQRDSIALEKMATIPYATLDLQECFMKISKIKARIEELESKNQKDKNDYSEISKLKEELAQEWDEKIIYDKLSEILNTIYSYGSEVAINIVSNMQSENYLEQTGKLQRDSYRSIAFYILLATQVKYDVTGVMISPKLWYKMRITEYKDVKKIIQDVNNKIVKELNLDKRMMI